MMQKYAKQLLHIFFSSGQPVCTFSEAVSTQVLENVFEKLCVLNPKDYLGLIEKPDKLCRILRTIYDILSAPKNDQVVMVKTTYQKESHDKQDDRESVGHIDYKEDVEYEIMFVHKKNMATGGYCGHLIETVQTLPGQFLFLNTPWYSRLPGNTVKVLLNRGSLYPVLSGNSPRIKLTSAWKSFCAKRQDVPMELFSSTQTMVDKIYRQELTLRIQDTWASFCPSYNASKCEALCMAAWLGLGHCVRHRGDLFLRNLFQEIKNDLEKVDLNMETWSHYYNDPL